MPDRPPEQNQPTLFSDPPIPVPRMTAQQMLEANQAAIPRGVKMGVKCVVHTHDEWVPIELHHIWPLGMGGPDKATNKISVCANGHYSIHAAMDLMIKNGHNPPWTVMQHFGPKVRAWAREGWTRAGEPRIGQS